MIVSPRRESLQRSHQLIRSAQGFTLDSRSARRPSFYQPHWKRRSWYRGSRRHTDRHHCGIHCSIKCADTRGFSDKADALSSVIAALYIGGLAGDFAARDLGMRSMVASDISEHLSEAFCSLDPEGEIP